MMCYGVWRNGGFAEYCSVKAGSIYKMAPSLDYEVAALTEPVSCVLHCIERAEIKAGDSVVILGAGFTGQLLIRLAWAAGAGKVIAVSRSQWKLDLALRTRATDVVRAGTCDVKEAVLDLTDGKGAEVVIEAVGKVETTEQAVSFAKEQGKIVFFGLSPEGRQAKFLPFDVVSKELTIKGSWLYSDTFLRGLNLLTSGYLDVKDLISKKILLDEIPQSLPSIAERPGDFMKSLVLCET